MLETLLMSLRLALAAVSLEIHDAICGEMGLFEEGRPAALPKDPDLLSQIAM